MADEKIDIEFSFIPETLRVFISYCENDKLIATGIKKTLNRYGIQAFLAHEDIPPGKDWEQEILRNIQQSDVFMAVITEEFRKSEWTDQEIGVAIANSKLVIPICIQKALPHGFMKKFQAFKKFKHEILKNLDGEEYVECNEDIKKIVKFIAENEHYDFRKNVVDSLITNLENPGNFRSAEEYFNLMLPLGPFDDAQINQICIESSKNRQVYDAHGCQSQLKKLLKKYKNSITKENSEEIQKLIS